ncbi:nostrin isoform X4 [Narcine bancroftii]|uniref:nostrin isoform X4 n=1 Tax=Narcine bancroftii TaxID=1343680 RepID=UPI0038315F26
MKDPVSGCTYHKVYQHIKKFAKSGDNYCKELVCVLQQRADLEKTYAKGLLRLANKYTKASKDIIKNSIFEGWNCISQEMTFTADLHTTLANAIQQEAVNPICKMLDEHTKRRKLMDNAVEKSSKLVMDNWSQQIRCKKKMMGLAKDHERMFRAAENNKQIISEKERRKLLKKLKKSTEVLSKTDQQYYDLNRAGEDVRLKWESIFEESYQVIHDLEKEKINLLCNILNKYSQHITCFGRTLIERQMQILDVAQNVSVDQDIQTLLDNSSILSSQNKIGFLLTDYYAALKLTLLEVNLYKLASSLAELEGNPIPSHPLSNSITNWKDKEYYHSMVEITRPVKIKNVSHPSNLMNSVSLDHRRDPHEFSPQKISESEPIYINHTTNSNHSEIQVAQSRKDATSADYVNDPMQEIGICKALYDYQAARDDELNMQQGDVLIIYSRDVSGWWIGSLRGKKGIFPATYVEELPKMNSTSEA